MVVVIWYLYYLYYLFECFLWVCCIYSFFFRIRLVVRTASCCFEESDVNLFCFCFLWLYCCEFVFLLFYSLLGLVYLMIFWVKVFASSNYLVRVSSRRLFFFWFELVVEFLIFLFFVYLFFVNFVLVELVMLCCMWIFLL